MGTTPASDDARTIEIPFRWADVEGAVRAVVATNEDPAAFGCTECARGFPYCRATVEPPARGYADASGWVQLVDRSDLGGELFEFRREARAILGFSWGFSKCGQQIEWFGPDLLSSQDWDGHLGRLTEERSQWSFRPGFSQHPLEQ